MVTPFENGLAKRGTRFIDIAEMLFDEGYQVEYYTSNFSHAYKYIFSQKQIVSEKEKRRYPIHFIPVKGYSKNISIQRIWSNFLMSRDLLTVLKKTVTNDDIVIIPSRPVDFVYYISKLKKQNKHLKLVLDIRDIWPDAFNTKNVLFEYYCNYFLNRSLNKFDLFFHISPSFQSWLNRYYKEVKSIFVPPGFSTLRWENTPFIEKKESKIIKFVFVGALQYQLDILPFIKAISNKEKYHLTIIGEDGQGQRFSECNDFIKNNETLNVEIKGVMEPDQIPLILYKYDIGIIPMISSSITNKTFDYIASYLPIFALGDNDTSDFVKNLSIGWSSSFQVKDIELILEQITFAKINIIRKDISKIRETYSRDNLYKKITQNISKLCNK